MTDQERDVATAASVAAINAYRIIEEYGVEAGAPILRGVASSYLRAMAAVEGWPAVLELVRQQYSEHIVPLRDHKLTLAYSRDAAKAAS